MIGLRGERGGLLPIGDARPILPSSHRSRAMNAKRMLAWALGSLWIVGGAVAGPLDDVYRLGPDSDATPRRPARQGHRARSPCPATSTPTPPATTGSTSPPSTTRPGRPRLMVFFDGHAYVGLKGDYRIPYVFDNLIYRREMPVTIGVFINPGHGPDQKEATDADWGDQDSTNRRVEYNALDDKYSKLVVDELLPGHQEATTTSPTTRNAGRSRGPAPGRSARSPSPGTGPTSSARWSAPSAASPTSWAATPTPT